MSCTTDCRKPKGNQAHCGAEGCHRTFSTVANFDKHRTGDVEHRHCVDPATVGLRLGADEIWRGEPGTWRPRPQDAEASLEAESPLVGVPPRVENSNGPQVALADLCMCSDHVEMHTHPNGGLGTPL